MNPLHDSEKVVGRITVRRTLDRRYKIVHAQPEPTSWQWSDVWQALAGFFVLALMFGAVFIWMAIGQAAAR